MNEIYPLSLVVFDFVPVIFFVIGAYYLVSIAVRMCGLRCGQLAMFGSLLIFIGGILKATWKLLNAIGIDNFEILSEIQFVLLSPGFLALLFVVISMARGERIKIMNTSLVFAIAVWKIPLLIVTTLAGVGLQGMLFKISLQRKANFAATGFAVAFLCLIGMGAMASGQQTLVTQWVEESINTLGQAGFMVGNFLLRRNISDLSPKA